MSDGNGILTISILNKKSIISLTAGVTSSTSGILILSSKPSPTHRHQRKLPWRDWNIIDRQRAGSPPPRLLVGLRTACSNVSPKHGPTCPCIRHRVRLPCLAAGSKGSVSPAQPNLNPQVSWGAASWTLEEGTAEAQGQHALERGTGFGSSGSRQIFVNGQSREAWVSVVRDQGPVPSLFQ